MRVVLDKDGNRLYADNPERYKECFCPACGENLMHKIGKKYKPYFSHMRDTECAYGKDKDNKSEWHIRMQDYFPRETKEFRFVDPDTKEIHIADVFLKDRNLVFEFQHSPIDGDEFWNRTMFHIRKGRKVVWFFDESSKGTSNEYGRFKKDNLFSDRGYKWLRNPRSFLIDNYIFVNTLVRICVYTGTEGDIFHIIEDYHGGFDLVDFSATNIEMCNLDLDSFFGPMKQPNQTKSKEVPKHHSIYELWEPDYYQMVVYNFSNSKYYLIHDSYQNDGKMQQDFYNRNCLLYKYVDWKNGRYTIRSNNYYSLSDFVASQRIWMLMRAYIK